MRREPTPEQKRAIDEQSKTLLVSAAAGSGKTFTLVERVMRSVTREDNPIPLDRLLVVTFTNDTAADLKQRISAAVSEAAAANGKSEHLARQISLLPSAKFSTIDSFCLSLVRSNYARLGISPSFRIADESEAKLIEHDTMEMLINSCYDDTESKVCGGPDGFARLVDVLVGSGNDTNLCDTLLKLYAVLSAYPKGAAALYDTASDLEKYSDDGFYDSPYGELIKNHVIDFFSHYKDLYARLIKEMECDEKLASSYCITFENDYAALTVVLDKLKESYIKNSAAMLEIPFATLKSYKGEKSPFVEYIANVRKAYKDGAKALAAKYALTDTHKLKTAILETVGICRALGDLFTKYEELLEGEKKRKNLCTFSDLSRYTLRLLVDKDGNDTPFADEQKKLFDAIYIDEYQDVNAVQNRIFEAISTSTNRFMVGDIKQSIYAFRGAEPSIFAELRNIFPKLEDAAESDSATVFMSTNFRCSKEIIGFTNAVCDVLMPLMSPSINYDKEDSLVLGKVSKSNASHPVRIVAIENPPKGSPDYGKNREAEYIANEILRLVNGEKKDDGEPIGFGDIAILMRAPKTKVDTYSNTLRSHGIPVFAETEEDLLSQSEVEVVRCFMEAVDNPRRDIPLAGALLSPIGNVSCDFLAALRKNDNDRRLITVLREYAKNGSGDECKKISAFLEKLGEYRKMARFMSAGEFADTMYADMAIPQVLGGSSRSRRANLEKFRQLAYGISTSTSLSSFLRHLRNNERSGKVIPAARSDLGAAGAVRILSVHASKGLEFPVVFYANTLTKPRPANTTESPLYTSAQGFGIMLRDETGFLEYDTPMRKSVYLAKENAEKQEELRKLYVALTRARERLYITGKCKDPQELLYTAELEHKALSHHLAFSKVLHFDLITLALGTSDGEDYTFETVPYVNAMDAEAEVAAEAEKAVANEETVALLKERFSYEYHHRARTKIPAKLSLSRLYPDILDEEILETSIGDKPLPTPTVAPRFIANEENLAAKRGTATHLFMQFFDFENAAKAGSKAELDRLLREGFISSEDAGLVNLDEVDGFLSSSLFSEIRGSKRIYREQRFNLQLPAAEFALDASLKKELCDETVLVQGVIDCFFFDENGDIVLIDYKTDRVFGDREAAKDKLRAAHSRQLGYYSRAIEEICGKPPKRSIIFSLALGEAIVV